MLFQVRLFVMLTVWSSSPRPLASRLSHQRLSSLISLQQGTPRASLFALRGVAVTFIPLRSNAGK